MKLDLRLAALPVVLVLCACASPDRPGRGRGGPPQLAPDFAGAKMATPMAMFFAGLDNDGDLFVSRLEVEPAILREWERADADRNGRLSAFEYEDWMKTVLGDPEARPGRIAFDKDLDGEISQNDFESRLLVEFTMLDRNDDGRISRQELLTTLRAGPPMSRGPGRSPSGGGRPPPGGGQRPPG